MQLRYNKEQLISVLNDFNNITGLNINIVDTDYNKIGQNDNRRHDFCNIIQNDKNGLKRCSCSDRDILLECAKSKKAEIHTCHAGLTDIAVPVINNDTVIAYIILGQIKKDISFETILNNTNELSYDKKSLKKSYDNLTTFDDKRIKSIANIALMLAEHILINNMLSQVSDTHIQRSTKYIEENINSAITVTDICKEINISKSVLYKSFKNRLNITPNQYINQKKVAKAKFLMNNSDLSVKEIAYSLGFTNTTYFHKLFKRITGITPAQFKNKVK